jgi:hypothetical protein
MNRFLFASVVLLFFQSWKVQGQMAQNYFPQFQAYAGNPIVQYGDGFADAAWNDPCVLFHNGQYIMYLTAAEGIVLSSGNTVKVYRMISSDGYNWTLSPSTPVLQPLAGTYYDGGTETPSVVFKDSLFHIYLTCYPPGNNPDEFVIAHGISTDGLSWTMDAAPILTSDGSQVFYGELVGEPGAVVYHDSIYVYFTAAGLVGGNFIQTIGLMKSADGSNFSAPQPTVFLPQDVYPLSDNYWGLSTPSALAINDSLYLFTDVARVNNGAWTQVALHQFKTYGNTGVWYHNTLAIHRMEDFSWTDGDYLSNLLAPCPLLESNGRLRIWYAGHRLAEVNGIDTTYNVSVDSTGFIHVLPAFWGIGTSEFMFPAPVGDKAVVKNESLLLYPSPAADQIMLNSPWPEEEVQWEVYDMSGRSLKQYTLLRGGTLTLSIHDLAAGEYFVQASCQGKRVFSRFSVER